MKRILLSLGMIVFVGAVAVSATGAFFSDTETSTGNTFTAGDIDLKIDNTSYILATTSDAGIVLWPATTWTLDNLTIQKFFDFIDLKPGDIGEDTISIHVGSNDAWLCAAARITQDDDNGITEPEDEAATGPNNQSDGTTDGDLDSGVNFAFWVDDGDNVFEGAQGEEGPAETIFLGVGPLSDLGQSGQIALADDAGGVLGAGNPVPGGSTFHIGKAWCFGAMTPLALANDANTSPADRQATGFNCDGSNVGNIAQTDLVVGDLEFYAEQARNNGTFLCSKDYTPSWTPPPTPPVAQ